MYGHRKHLSRPHSFARPLSSLRPSGGTVATVVALRDPRAAAYPHSQMGLALAWVVCSFKYWSNIAKCLLLCCCFEPRSIIVPVNPIRLLSRLLYMAVPLLCEIAL